MKRSEWKRGVLIAAEQYRRRAGSLNALGEAASVDITLDDIAPPRLPKSSNERSKSTYQSRREQGLCVRCGKPAARNRNGEPMSMCDEHLSEQAAKQAERKSREVG